MNDLRGRKHFARILGAKRTPKQVLAAEGIKETTGVTLHSCWYASFVLVHPVARPNVSYMSSQNILRLMRCLAPLSHTE
ncbi:MAG: hypothetical protein V4595_12330 [Pseudomonadota bacterium]